MVTFKKSYTSSPFSDTTTQSYVYGRPNGSIIADVDKNGFLDIVTFPSTHSTDTPYQALIWLNTDGVFTAHHPNNPNEVEYQYIRNSESGDFNNDGYLDFFSADTGWELNGRDPDYFFGNNPLLMLGTESSVEIAKPDEWMLSGANTVKTFNHISTTADFDNDGDLDVAIAAFSDFRLYENDGNANFTWRQDLVANDYSSLPWEYGSGTSFIKLGDEYALAVGFYRNWSLDNVNDPPVILTMQDGKFDVAYHLERPDLNGRELNYGAVDMYNIDINNDGREDLLILWETEALGGIDDSDSTIVDNVYYQGTRYKDLSNTLLTLWTQDETGKLVKSDTPYYNLEPSISSGTELRFADLNNDGLIDFYALPVPGYSLHSLEDLIWINDGNNNFVNPEEDTIQINEDIPEWYKANPYFFDANNDGVTDIVTVRGVFENETYDYRNVGEEVSVYIGEGVAASERYAYGSYTDSFVQVTAPGVVDVHNEAGNQHFASVDRVIFDDAILSFEEPAEQLYRMYDTVVGEAPEPYALGHLMSMFDKGTTIDEFASIGVDVLGDITNEEFVTTMYNNVLDRDPDPVGFEFWVDALDNGHSREEVLYGASESAEHIALLGMSPGFGVVYHEYQEPTFQLVSGI